MNNDEETYINFLKKIKDELPNINIPSMGIMEEEKEVDINIKEFMKDNGE